MLPTVLKEWNDKFIIIPKDAFVWTDNWSVGSRSKMSEVGSTVCGVYKKNSADYHSDMDSKGF